MDISQHKFGWGDKIKAWSVHIFTASGLLAGFMAILAIQAHDWRGAMLWLVVCQIVDGVDGTFARLFKVKEVLPFMDGQSIDYVIDFATYAIIPAYFIYEMGLVTGPWNLICTFVILLVSAIYYGKDGMVSEDMCFVGFPVMWNLVVFYLVFIFHLPEWGNAVTILFFAILHFVPIKFPYPSRSLRWRKPLLIVAGAGIVAGVLIIWNYPEEKKILQGMTVVGIAFYGMVSLRETFFPAVVPNPL